MSKIFFYHKNCKDGIGSAYAAYERFGEDAKYIPIAYGYEDRALDKATSDSEVYFIDFSLKRDAMIEFANRVKSVEVIDHHKSAENELVDLPSNVTVNFDMSKSGAVLTWERFHDTPVPEILHYIEDRDIWKWEMYKSREFAEGLIFSVKDNDILGFRELANKGMETIEQFQNIEEILLSAKTRRIDTIIEKIKKGLESFVYKLNGKDFILVNFTEKSEVSDLGNRITEEFNIPAAVYSVNGDNVSISLRSNKKAGVIRDVAVAFGGGGHDMASGMGIKIDDFHELLKTKKLDPISKRVENKNIQSVMDKTDETLDSQVSVLKK